MRIVGRILPLLALLGCEGALELSSVTPSLVSAGTRTPVQVEGAGFDEGLTLALQSGAAEVGLGSVAVASGSAASGEIPPAAPAGVYDLVANLGALSARLDGALEIVQGEARVIFVDVDQGDATLIIAPDGEVALIDGGPPDARDAVRAAIDAYAGGRLDVAILSHHDADHLGGLVGVLAGNDTEVGTSDDLIPARVFGPADDGSCDTLTCNRFRALRAYPFETPSVGAVIELGEVELEVVAVDGDVGAGRDPAAQDPNERSLVVLVRFADREVLVLGDLTGGGEGTADLESPLAARTGPVDVLRTGHHGSRTSSNPTALATWSPLAAVVSMGTDNVYCHPAQEVLDRLAAATPRVFGTGSGILSSSRCEATEPAAGVQLGLGDVVLRIDREGAMTLADEPL